MSDHRAEIPSQPATIKRGGGRRWIHAAEVKGRFNNLRIATSLVLLVVFYGTPWLTIEGQPFLKLSFLSSSFVMFGQPILIYEFYHFVFLALLLVMTLFLASTFYGRIWCGYSCPQSVFVEQIFGRIETFFEGPAAHRIVQEAKPLTAVRVLRKVGKQLSFGLVSASFAFSLIALFTGPEALLSHPRAATVTAFSLLTALAWFDGGYWREQFCHIVCPYGRFQGVMQDAATRTIGYDTARGEPRKRGKNRDGAGDCIDCSLCVRVCPSGIDIRQGAHQLECIACAKCVDACDGVMGSLGKPRGLIRYDAVAMFAPESPPRAPSVLRPRLIAYVAVWLALFGIGLYQFVHHTTLHVTLLSARGAPPYVLDGVRVKSLFNVKVGNQTRHATRFKLALAAPVPADLRIESPTTSGPVPPGAEATFPVLVSFPRDAAATQITLSVRAEGSGEEKLLSRLLTGPGGQATREDGDLGGARAGN